jgi:hypothetical protein
LRDNEIEDKGAAEIAAVLHVNRSLATLDLSRNAIGDKAARDIVTAICGGGPNNIRESSLLTLKLKQNKFSEEVKEELEFAKDENPTLLHLDLR